MPGCTVDAGNKTGVYFIPLSNLEWKTTWQQLKDFVRECDGYPLLDVLEAAVYGPNKGYGWVSINGGRDFSRAMKVLNGAVFRGRSIVAEGKNDKIPIPLMSVPTKTAVQSVNSYAQSSSDPHLSSAITTSLVYKTPPGAYQPYTPAVMPLASAISPVDILPNSNYQVSYASFVPQQPYFSTGPISPISPPTSYASSSLDNQYHSSLHSTYLPNMITYYSTIPSPPTTNPNLGLTSTPRHADTSRSPNDPILLSQRRVFISKLSKKATANQIRAFVLKTALNAGVVKSSAVVEDVIEKLELPKGMDGGRRSHGVVMLRSCRIARAVLESLDGRVWMGERMGARWDRHQPGWDARVDGEEEAEGEDIDEYDEEEEDDEDDIEDYNEEEQEEEDEEDVGALPKSPPVVDGSSLNYERVLAHRPAASQKRDSKTGEGKSGSRGSKKTSSSLSRSNGLTGNKSSSSGNGKSSKSSNSHSRDRKAKEKEKERRNWF